MSNAYTIDRAMIEDAHNFDGFIREVARKRTQAMDDIVLSALKPWQQRVVRNPRSSKIMKWLAKRTAGITIEHHAGELLEQSPGNLQRTDRIVIKQRGVIIGRV